MVAFALGLPLTALTTSSRIVTSFGLGAWQDLRCPPRAPTLTAFYFHYHFDDDYFDLGRKYNSRTTCAMRPHGIGGNFKSFCASLRLRLGLSVKVVQRRGPPEFEAVNPRYQLPARRLSIVSFLLTLVHYIDRAVDILPEQ